MDQLTFRFPFSKKSTFCHGNSLKIWGTPFLHAFSLYCVDAAFLQTCVPYCFFNTECCSGKVDDAAFCERGAQTLLQKPYEIEYAFSTQNRKKIVRKLLRTRFSTEVGEIIVPGVLLDAPGPALECPGRLLGLLGRSRAARETFWTLPQIS